MRTWGDSSTAWKPRAKSIDRNQPGPVGDRTGGRRIDSRTDSNQIRHVQVIACNAPETA